MTDRKKPTAGFWITVALVAVLVGYPLSFGPACWAISRAPQWSGLWGATNFVYSPILRMWWRRDGKIPNAIGWYANIGTGVDLTVGEADDGTAYLGIICHAP